MNADTHPPGIQRSVTHSGGSLFVLDYPGKEPAIVAMHGFPDDLHIYDRLVRHLSGRRIVLFDWLGYGRSGRRDSHSFRSADRQRDLTAVVEGLGLGEVFLVGHDASGPEAILFALSQPGRVRGVALLNTYFGRTSSLRFPEIIALLANPELKELAAGLTEDVSQRQWLLQHSARLMGIPANDPAGIASVSIVPQFFGGKDQPSALAEIQAWARDIPHALDLQDRLIASGELKTLKSPVTVAFGAKDRYLNPDLARHLASLFGRSQLRLIDGAAHWPQWEQPAVVAQLIEEGFA